MNEFSPIQDQVNMLCGKIELTNKDLELVNKNLKRLRKELTYIIPKSGYFRDE